MRLLLDECVHELLARDLPGYEVATVTDAGLKGFKNGELLKAASGKFDVLITIDKVMKYQQNLNSLPMTILLLHTRTNRLEHLQELIPAALEALPTLGKSEFREVHR
jgi:predicted nuclease of predicted toxin-antitoxin system